MRPSQVMQALYDSEITIRTEPHGCWNNGFRAQIGDDDNGYEEPIIYGYKWDELMTNLGAHVANNRPHEPLPSDYRPVVAVIAIVVLALA